MFNFQIPSDVLPQALKAYNDSPKTFKAMANMAPTFFGVDSDTFTKAFHKVRADASRAEGFKTLSETVAKAGITKGILNVLAQGQAWVEENTIQEVKDKDDNITTAGFVPKLSWSIDYVPANGEDSKAVAKLVCSIGAARRPRRVSKEGDKKGRISAYVAWDKTGKVQGDTFNIVKCDGGYKVDGRFVNKGKLTGFLLSVHPNSKTIEKMKQYPEMNIG